jgi:hypothetical protein
VSTFLAALTYALIAALVWWLAWGEDWWVRVRADRELWSAMRERQAVKDALR